MATILLSAAGAAIGGALGGGALGVSSAVIGRAIGASLGRAIDQSLLGTGSQTVETGKLDRMRVMGASEGGAVPRVFGRVRVPGNVIWTSNYRENVTEFETGGKGAPKGPTTRAYSYSISVAIGICEGEIARVGRVWADGQIVQRSSVTMRVYTGSEDQLPDSVMTAIEGEGRVPAYRGLAYVVFEDLQLEPYGNRVPQFSFEVIRPAQPAGMDATSSLADLVQGVAMLPGSGEYALASSPVYETGPGGQTVARNVNTSDGQVDLLASLEALTGELPKCRSTSLVVSWFGDDLRVGHCQCQPKVEFGGTSDGAAGLGHLGTAPVGGHQSVTMPWQVSGLSRSDAEVVAQVEGRPVYGGTPCDASVIEAIAALREAGQEVMFYPFLLMEILAGNTLPDPWNGDVGQAVLPWRGRITTELAPGVAGSSDQTAQARSEVNAFMGNAAVSDFEVFGTTIRYTGPPEFSYRRFILHYAHLCALAGGVDAFCIGSEMRAMTQIRDETGGFPAVEALKVLAAEVKGILPDAKVGYAADWSEYFGYHPQDGTGDVLFHLDPLWADPAIDFVGIDNYMPISDWRDGDDHLDAAVGQIYDLEYLVGNIAGGEGYDWFYASDADRDAQIRTEISDGAYGEPWVWRYKDLLGWWGQAHHNRIGGQRSVEPTAWVPESKPIWFTELGCAAIDKGTNQPNKFQDPKSSESALPYYSTGRRDDYLQLQYLRAYAAHFDDAVRNPVSSVYGEAMVDMSKAHVWAWDARSWPEFPNNVAIWSDGENHLTGHWLTGRSAVQTLSSVVAELCEDAGLSDYDVSGLHGILRGYSMSGVESARASLQSLMVAFGFDAIEAGGRIVFRNRAGASARDVDEEDYVLPLDGESVIEMSRAPEAEVVGEVVLGYVESEADFATHVVSARLPDDRSVLSTQNDLPLALTPSEAHAIAQRWLSEARIAQDTVRLHLPPSRSDIGAGDVIALNSDDGGRSFFRVDRVEDGNARAIEAVRVEDQIYIPQVLEERLPVTAAATAAAPLTVQFLDLPLLRGNESPHAPYIAVSASPWPGGAAVYEAAQDSDYQFADIIEQPSVMGVTRSPLGRARSGIWDLGSRLEVELLRGHLSSTSRTQLLSGTNVAVIGDGSSDYWEVFQFANAELIGPGLFALSDMLRGQAGTDGVMPDVWPVGSQFILLDGAAKQLTLDSAKRGLERHYRIGPATRSLSDPTFRHYALAIDGVGLRPYSPVHLRSWREEGDILASWVRRTRIEGDSWAGRDVPVGEEEELYLFRLVQGEVVLHEVELRSASWRSDGIAIEGLSGPVEIQVAQISQRFGPGPFARKMIHV